MDIIRSAPDPACIAVLLGHRAHIRACAFSPNGDRIVSGDASGIVKVWDANTGEALATAGTTGRKPWIKAVRFSRDGSQIEVTFDDGVVEVRDASTGNQLSVFEPDRNDLVLLGVSPNRTRAVAATPDGAVWLWEIPGGEQIECLGNREHCGPLRFSRDGSRVVTGFEGHNLNLWSAVAGTLIATLPNTEFPAVFSPRSDRLVTMPIAGTLRLWDTAAGRELAGDLTGTILYRWNPRSGSFWDADDNGPMVTAYAFSPNGNRIAAISTNGDLTIVDARNGHNLGTVDANESGLYNGCAFSPDGARLLSWDLRGFKLWDVASGEEALNFAGPPGGLIACDYSPDGKRIVTAGNDRGLRIWDATKRPALADRTTLPGRVLYSNFSPDGKTLLHAVGGSLIFWDAQTLGEQSRQAVNNGPGVVIQDCTWTPDGARVLAAAENEVTVWEGGAMQARIVHGAPVEACAISPNGERVISCDKRNQIMLCDAATGQTVRADQFQEEAGPLAALAFSPDGAMIVAATVAEIKVLDAVTGADIAKVRGLPGRVPIWVHDPGLRLITVGTAEEGTYELRDALTGGEVEARSDQRFAPLAPTGSPFRDFLQRNFAVSLDGKCLARWGLRKDNERPYALELFRLAGSPTHLILDGHDDAIRICRFSPDGAHLASVSHDETLRIWEVATGRELSAYWAESFSSCAWSPDGYTLIAGGYYGGVHLLRLEGSAIASGEAVSNKTRARAV
jgi:WD40 repeat protein